ncbi:hypothetical protein QRB35_25260, partial [Mycobacterium intracellulare subsp. chimaera]|nr:hypothetical protein [Mycobacterium intracellulare subsp. chimaera]
MKADPAWQTARDLPRRSPAERAIRRSAFREVEAVHGFTGDAAQSLASSLRRSWVREYLPAQETQSLGARAFDAVRQWHVGAKGKPRFKSVKRGLHSLAAKDGNGALRPKTDEAGRLVGLQWGAGFVIPIAPAAVSGRRGREQQAELAEIDALIAAGSVARSMNNETAGRHEESPHLQCGEDVNLPLLSSTHGPHDVHTLEMVSMCGFRTCLAVLLQDIFDGFGPRLSPRRLDAMAAWVGLEDGDVA